MNFPFKFISSNAKFIWSQAEYRSEFTIQHLFIEFNVASQTIKCIKYAANIRCIKVTGSTWIRFVCLMRNTVCNNSFATLVCVIFNVQLVVLAKFNCRTHTNSSFDCQSVQSPWRLFFSMFSKYVNNVWNERSSYETATSETAIAYTYTKTGCRSLMWRIFCRNFSIWQSLEKRWVCCVSPTNM